MGGFIETQFYMFWCKIFGELCYFYLDGFVTAIIGNVLLIFTSFITINITTYHSHSWNYLVNFVKCWDFVHNL